MSEQHAQLGQELAAIAVRTAPGAAASFFTLNSLVALLTAAFLLLQIGHLAWKWRREWLHARNNRAMAAEAKKRADEKP